MGTLLLGACAGVDGVEGLEQQSQELDAFNGINLNGINLNGINLNGINLNGINLNGINLNGINLNGVTLSGSTLTGVRSGTTVTGAGMVGALLSGTLSNGATLTLRVDSYGLGTAPNTDVAMYGVSYQTTSGWLPLCGLDTATGAPILAIVDRGTWDYSVGTKTGGSWNDSKTQITFACRKTAIAKCLEMGYKPWKLVPGQTASLRGYLVACTRMLRADYCGDGTPWTVNGRVVDVYDGVGIQVDTESWTFEAEWDPAGAPCVTSKRVLDAQNQGQALPDCVKPKTIATCGLLSHFTTGTLLMDEYQTLLVVSH